MLFRKEPNRLIAENKGEKIYIESYGKDCLRFRSSVSGKITEENWTLLPPDSSTEIEIELGSTNATIKNGRIIAEISEDGMVKYYSNEGKILLEELWINRKTNSANLLEARTYKAISSDLFRVKLYFKSYTDEGFYGMGQYANGNLNLKGTVLELAQKNTQITIPFLLSTRNYGFIWNNPAIGRVELVNNHTLWYAEATKQIDYLIFYGDTPQEIVEKYGELTGKPPMLPKWAVGFWQSKLRYRTQEELLKVAREYKRRKLPLSVIVIDFFHWPKQGDWRFDKRYWPDPQAMVDELNKMGIKLMVSIWPSVDRESENYKEMMQRGLLLRTERGIPFLFTFQGLSSFFDATNPEARRFMWEKVKKNYYDYGIKMFWLDETEPEMDSHDFENVRYHIGNGAEIANIYPYFYAKTFYDGMKDNKESEVVNLARSAWLGSQRFGVVIWSGDIPSTFESLRNQLKAGLNISLSGIPWWTTDIGGFWGGDPNDETFRELIVRWFQFGVFCPIFRLHGFRFPYPDDEWHCEKNELTGGDNEVWSFGRENYEIIKKLLFLRETMKPYILVQMKTAHERGVPVMRPLFFDFPSDERCYKIEDEYMFGPDILVAPVLYKGMRRRNVYFPSGEKWVDVNGNTYEGGQEIEYRAPLNTIPFFFRGTTIPFKI